jgi:hypothetical protein
MTATNAAAHANDTSVLVSIFFMFLLRLKDARSSA